MNVLIEIVFIRGLCTVTATYRVPMPRAAIHEFCMSVNGLLSAFDGTTMQKFGKWFESLKNEVLSADGRCRFGWCNKFQKYAEPPHSHANIEDLIVSKDDKIYIGHNNGGSMFLDRLLQSRTTKVDINDPVYKKNFLSILSAFNTDFYTLSVQK